MKNSSNTSSLNNTLSHPETPTATFELSIKQISHTIELNCILYCVWDGRLTAHTFLQKMLSGLRSSVVRNVFQLGPSIQQIMDPSLYTTSG